MSTTDVSKTSIAVNRKYTWRFAVTALSLIALEIVWVLYGNDHWWIWPFYVTMLPCVFYYLHKSNYNWSRDE